MSIVDFELPDELKSGVSAEEINQAMLSRIKGYDKTEGGFVWDMTMPTALEKAELLEFWLPLALKMMSHIWATGRWLDYHARDCGLFRKEATYAYGDVEVTTSKAVIFPRGFIFSVPSENSVPAIDFEVVNPVVTVGEQTVTVRVKAVNPGPDSNVDADTITIMKNPIKGVTHITNPNRLTGGTVAETDASLRQRIDDFYAGRGSSFVGNRKDYERWAREVAGVAYAKCIPNYFQRWLLELAVTDANNNPIKGSLQLVAGSSPNELKIVAATGTKLTGKLEYTGKNSVKILVCDSNGDGAVDEKCAEVETYIFGGKDTSEDSHNSYARLAPIGVTKWSVSGPEGCKINVKADVKLEGDSSKELVIGLFEDALRALFISLADDEFDFNALKYVDVSECLNNVTGVDDFKHLRISANNGDYGLDNITFPEGQMPVVGTITFNDY